MRVAIAFNNVVDNIIEAPSLAVAKQVYPGATTFEAGAVGMGWVKSGGSWVAPPVVAVPVSLTHLQFIDHIQAVGNVTDNDLVAAKTDPNLAAFWIKFEMATSLDRDNSVTQQGLAALVATGYLTSQSMQAVIDQWPTT